MLEYFYRDGWYSSFCMFQVENDQDNIFKILALRSLYQITVTICQWLLDAVGDIQNKCLLSCSFIWVMALYIRTLFCPCHCVEQMNCLRFCLKKRFERKSIFCSQIQSIFSWMLVHKFCFTCQLLLWTKIKSELHHVMCEVIPPMSV